MGKFRVLNPMMVAAIGGVSMDEAHSGEPVALEPEQAAQLIEAGAVEPMDAKPPKPEGAAPRRRGRPPKAAAG